MLGKEATEEKVRGRKLSDYRVLAFATHGLISGELAGLAEPALVLTPPDLPPGKKAHPANDGLLLGSEVTALSLDADWVILSACNFGRRQG